jgi:hypothetical protein
MTPRSLCPVRRGSSVHKQRRPITRSIHPRSRAPEVQPALAACLVVTASSPTYLFRQQNCQTVDCSAAASRKVYVSPWTRGPALDDSGVLCTWVPKGHLAVPSSLRPLPASASPITHLHHTTPRRAEHPHEFPNRARPRGFPRPVSPFLFDLVATSRPPAHRPRRAAGCPASPARKRKSHPSHRALLFPHHYSATVTFAASPGPPRAQVPAFSRRARCGACEVRCSGAPWQVRGVANIVRFFSHAGMGSWYGGEVVFVGRAPVAEMRV